MHFVPLQPTVQHAADPSDVDDVDRERPGTGGFDARRTIAVGEPQQPVDLAHACPGQWTVQQARGVGANRGPTAGRLLLQIIELMSRMA